MHYISLSDIKPVDPTLRLCGRGHVFIQLRRVSMFWWHNPRLVEWTKSLGVQKDNFIPFCLPWYNLEATRICGVEFCNHCKGVWWRCISKIWAGSHGVWISLTNVYHISNTCDAQSVLFCLECTEGGRGCSRQSIRVTSIADYPMWGSCSHQPAPISGPLFPQGQGRHAHLCYIQVCYFSLTGLCNSLVLVLPCKKIVSFPQLFIFM